MQIRRCFGTIHQGHLESGTIEDYFDSLLPKLEANSDYLAGAFALERGEDTSRVHIQFYCEHTRKRTSTLAADFGLRSEYVFDKVRDAPGAWAYCTQTGAHREKAGVIRSFTFGVPKLHGQSQRADLKLLVQLAMDGVTPEEMMRAYPYAWCVHRARMLAFFKDWDDLKRHGQLRSY